jgi:hypothetical protein
MNVNNNILYQLLIYGHSDNINNIKTMVQGQYIRDNKLNDILNIFSDKLLYEFIFKEFDIITDKKGNIYYDTYEDYNNFLLLDAMDIDTSILIKHILNIDRKSNKLTFFYVGVPLHVTGHYIIGNNVWIYEPYCYDYNYIIAFINEYTKYGFNIKKLPKYILKQGKLNLCYIYVLHCFIVKLLEINEQSYNYKIISHINVDEYISKITDNLTVFLYNYSCISEWNYYLLKNDITCMVNYVSDKKNIYVDIVKQVCHCINSKEMMEYIVDKIKISETNNNLQNIMNKCIYNYNIYDPNIYNFMIIILEVIIKKKNYMKLLSALSYIYINIIIDINIDFGNIKDNNVMWDIFFNSIIQKNITIYEKSMMYNYHTILIYNYNTEFFDYLFWYIIEYDCDLIISTIQLLVSYIDINHKLMLFDTITKIEKHKNIRVMKYNIN